MNKCLLAGQPLSRADNRKCPASQLNIPSSFHAPEDQGTRRSNVWMGRSEKGREVVRF